MLPNNGTIAGAMRGSDGGKGGRWKKLGATICNYLQVVATVTGVQSSRACSGVLALPWNFLPPQGCGGRILTSNRPKPHFIEVFSFSNRPKGSFLSDRKQRFRAVPTGLGTI